MMASDKEAHLSDKRSGTYNLPGNRAVRQGFEKVKKVLDKQN